MRDLMRRREPMVKFSRWELRTTDANAARGFYTKIFGHDRAVIWPLHEQALARGARPHWLGHLGVPDVERATAAFVERGAATLGPAPPTVEGGQAAVLRDPGGAIVALSTPPPSNVTANVEPAWYLLHSNGAQRAIVNYRELFGWEVKERLEVPAQGVVHPFAWHPGGPSVGAITDITGMPGRHPHWLFFFRVDALEPVIAITRAAGGLVLDPITQPSGERVCVCDDPQGAAFALLEHRP
jgi:predicted enzyme related to lactoylglutathione lyase